MKKRIITIALALLIIASIPMAVYAAADHQWYTGYTLKEFTCKACGNKWTQSVQTTCYIVNGNIVTSWSLTNTLCPNCGMPFQFEEPLVKPEKIPGAISGLH